MVLVLAQHLPQLSVFTTYQDFVGEVTETLYDVLLRVI